MRAVGFGYIRLVQIKLSKDGSNTAKAVAFEQPLAGR